MKSDVPIRQRILDAALQIMQESGVKKLTQPKVAKVAGIRQSHLTYYFPKKSDLVIGLLQGHIEGASKKLDAIKRGGKSDDIGAAMTTLVNNRRRMRFFMGLIIEADEDEALRKMVDEHIQQFHALVAHYFGRAEGDPDVEAFLNTLRGYGMINLVQRGKTKKVDVAALARTFGLTRDGA